MPKIHANDQQTTDQLPFGLDPKDLTDEDVLAAMKQISGYLDITPGDFKKSMLWPILRLISASCPLRPGR